MLIIMNVHTCTHTHTHTHHTHICTHTHTHTHTLTCTHQKEVRMLSGQLESVKEELKLEKQKCQLLEQNLTSATESKGAFLFSAVL